MRRATGFRELLSTHLTQMALEISRQRQLQVQAESRRVQDSKAANELKQRAIQLEHKLKESDRRNERLERHNSELRGECDAAKKSAESYRSHYMSTMRSKGGGGPGNSNVGGTGGGGGGGGGGSTGGMMMPSPMAPSFTSRTFGSDVSPTLPEACCCEALTFLHFRPHALCPGHALPRRRLARIQRPLEPADATSKLIDCKPQRQRLWVVNQSAPEATKYHSPICCSIKVSFFAVYLGHHLSFSYNSDTKMKKCLRSMFAPRGSSSSSGFFRQGAGGL